MDGLIAAVVAPIVAATLAGITYLWKARDKLYEREIERRDAEITACRSKIDSLQDAQLRSLQLQLDEARRQREVNVKLASAIQHTGGGK